MLRQPYRYLGTRLVEEAVMRAGVKGTVVFEPGVVDTHPGLLQAQQVADAIVGFYAAEGFHVPEALQPWFSAGFRAQRIWHFQQRSPAPS